jgi:hypothetical protein
MTDNLRTQIDGQRLVLFRLLTLLPTDRLQGMADSARRGLEHVDGGGETIPPTGPAERAAMAAELALLEEALVNRIEHEGPA